MRSWLLVLAAAPIVVASPALAHVAHPESESSCPSPWMHMDYDAGRFAVRASLPASGCPAREHRMFELSSRITRMDNNASHDVSEASTPCGPFRSGADFAPGEEAGSYSCDLSATMDHPSRESAQYDVDVTYPGADGQRTMSVVWFCTS